MKNIFLLLFLYSIHQPIFAQDFDDFPFSSLNYFKHGSNPISEMGCDKITVKHREVISETEGREYYCSGNVHAEGPLKFLKQQTVIEVDKKEVIDREYIRTGHWKVYHDSSTKLVRSEGNYSDGHREGVWKIYSNKGQQTIEIEFKDGLVKSKIELDKNGNRITTISRSKMTIFVLNNTILLIVLGVLPIVLFRICWNILTYNKIHNTKYIPGFQGYQKGGSTVNIICTFTFWWTIYPKDSLDVKSYKQTANYISIFSIICFAAVILLFVMFGEQQ